MKLKCFHAQCEHVECNWMVVPVGKPQNMARQDMARVTNKNTISQVKMQKRQGVVYIESGCKNDCFQKSHKTERNVSRCTGFGCFIERGTRGAQFVWWLNRKNRDGPS